MPCFRFPSKNCNLGTIQLRSIPITSQNELPHISIYIGSNKGDDTITYLYDTSTALSSREIGYKQPTMKVYHDIVESYEEFNCKNQFNSINSLGTISNSRNYNEDKPFILTAIVRYIRINRICDSFSRIITKYPTLELVIGPDVAVDAILGIPSIEGLQLELYFVPQNIVFYQLLQLQFPLEYRETRLSKPSKSLLTSTQNNYDDI